MDLRPQAHDIIRTWLLYTTLHTYLRENDIPQGYDLIMIARNTISDVKCQDVEKSLNSALKRSGVIKK